MRVLASILTFSLALISQFTHGQVSEKIKIYGLELGSQKSIYHQLGISQSSFYLEDGNFFKALTARDKTERADDQIACKQSDFGIKKALSEAYRQQAAQDNYLASRRESLNQRIRDDLANIEVVLISQTSKKYAQPKCIWAFNSMKYAGKPEPTLVSKFKSRAGIDKLTQLSMTFNHQGQLLGVGAEQIVERLDVERVDSILASIAKRYNLELDSVTDLDKEHQQKMLEGKTTVKFEKNGKNCEFRVKNTFYRSEAAAHAFGIEDAHAYINLQCEQTSGLSYQERKLQEFVSENVSTSISELLTKHKRLMKQEGQKEENAGFVF